MKRSVFQAGIGLTLLIAASCSSSSSSGTAGKGGSGGTGGKAGGTAGTTGTAGSGGTGTAGSGGTGTAGSGGTGTAGSGGTGTAGTGGTTVVDAGTDAVTVTCNSANATVTAPTIPFWSETGGSPDEFPATPPTSITCEEANSGTESLKLIYSGSFYTERGWKIPTTVDVSAATQFVFYIKVTGTVSKPSQLNLYLYGGAAAKPQAFVALDAGSGVGSGFNDGTWHKISVPLSSFQCSYPDNTDAGTSYLPTCTGSIDKTKIDKISISNFQAVAYDYVIYLDDIGFN